MDNIKIAFRKTSLVDYPGKVASVIFFPGCNLRCPWCYNWELVTGSPEDLISFGEAFAHIEKRKKLLGGIVLSGGEPTLQKDLPEIIARIKKDFALWVKLDTNGMRPEVLEKLFCTKETRPDFIALDIKLPPPRYTELIIKPHSIKNPDKKIIESIALVRASGIEHEFRTLQLPSPYFSAADLSAIKEAADEPVKIREFHGENCLDKTWNVGVR